MIKIGLHCISLYDHVYGLTIESGNYVFVCVCKYGSKNKHSHTIFTLW